MAWTQWARRALCGMLVVGCHSAAAWAAEETAARCPTEELSARFEGQQVRLLAVLSPRMVYTLQEWPRMKRAAEQAGFVIQALRDPRVPAAEWRAATETAGQPSLADLEPIDERLAGLCGLLNHSPAVLVGRCGSVHPWPVLGVMPDAAWLSVLRARSEGLKQPPCIP